MLKISNEFSLLLYRLTMSAYFFFVYSKSFNSDTSKPVNSQRFGREQHWWRNSLIRSESNRFKPKNQAIDQPDWAFRRWVCMLGRWEVAKYQQAELSTASDISPAWEAGEEMVSRQFLQRVSVQRFLVQTWNHISALSPTDIRDISWGCL